MKKYTSKEKIKTPILNLVKHKKYKEALNLLKDLSNEKGDQDFSNKIKGLIYLNQKDWEKSLIHYNKVSKEKINLFCLPDLLIIKNWLIYAKIIGDESYNDIYKAEVKTDHLTQFEIQKIGMRKKKFRSYDRFL